MKAAFPYMGDIHIVLKPIIETLGAEVITPPEPNKETLQLGTRFSPETICLPFKITLGNMLRALELGADTLIYVSGSWSCRFGYYGHLQTQILRELGYQFETIELRRDRMTHIIRQILSLNHGRLSQTLIRTARAFRLGLLKALIIEEASRLTRTLTPLTNTPGEYYSLFKSILKKTQSTENPKKLIKLRRSLAKRFHNLQSQCRANGSLSNSHPILRIKIIGESYCTIEPFVNFDLPRRLGEMGVIAEPFLTGPSWLGFHGFRLKKSEIRYVQKLARPYWRYCVGGEDANSLGHLILAALSGYDGAIYLHPFACMPSTAVQPVLIKVSQNYNIPLLVLSLDEHTSEAGFLTRVEAFVSLLERKRRPPP